MLVRTIKYGGLFILLASSGEAFGQTVDRDEDPPGSLATVENGSVRISDVGLEEALGIATRWLQNDRPDLAAQLLDQLASVWPDDARIPYLRGIAQRNLGNEQAAVDAFARALHLFPRSPVARYELARTLLALENWDRSAYHFRFLIAEETPVEIRAEVFRALSYIEDKREWRLSADFAIEPSNNINSAPVDPEIDPIFGGTTGAVLTEESTAIEGVGLRGRLGVVRYVPIAGMNGPDRRVRLLFGASASGVDQSDNRFDDISTALTTGIILRDGRHTFGIDGTLQKRWFGGDEYEAISGVGLSYSRYLEAPFVVHLELNAAERDNEKVDALDGTYLTGEARVRWQLGLTQSIDFATSSGRMKADASSQSFKESAVAINYSNSFSGGLDFTIGGALSQRDYDARDLFFDALREDEILSISAMAVQRDQQLWGFAPYVRIGWTQGDSTLKVHAFDRADIRIGFTSVY